VALPCQVVWSVVWPSWRSERAVSPWLLA